MDVVHRQPDGQTVDGAGSRPLRTTLQYRCDIGAGAAHVVADDVGESRRAGNEGGAHYSARGTGENQFRGGAGGFVDAERSSCGLCDAEVVLVAKGQARGQRFEIALHRRAQRGVDGGRAGALVLAEFGQDVAAEAYR